MVEKEQVAGFYDEFVAKQKRVGVSERHRIIFKRLKSLGLKRDSKVLEIGCGIGTVSSLIIRAIPRGRFLGVDISSQSIAEANRMYGANNATFRVDDMSDFSADLLFDFVVFPDVLEHIPVEQHSNLFEKVSRVCSKNAQVLINIPEPNALNWTRKHTPERLQIIDQSLSMQDLLNNTYPHGFQVQSITPYGIHTKVPNYLSIVLVRNTELERLESRGKIAKLCQNLKIRFL